jgi:hypothetical protein
MHSFGAIGSLIAFHQWWAIAVKVKHFRDRKQQSSTTTTTTATNNETKTSLADLDAHKCDVFNNENT